MSIPIYHLFDLVIVITLSVIRMTSSKYLRSHGYYWAVWDVKIVGWHS